MAIDPVCNMRVDERQPAATATVRGRTYYFCAPACKEAFVELGLGVEGERQPAQIVDKEGKPLSGARPPTGVVTVLFTDMQSSTTLLEELGHEAAKEVMWGELARQQGLVERYDGYAVKRLGDGMMAAFAAPQSAMHCAVDIQSDEQRDAKVRVRIGIHAGEVTVEAGDYFGKTVVLAARIMSRARGGETLVSDAFRSLFDPPTGWAFGATRRLRLKGLSGFQRVTTLEPVKTSV